MTMPLDQRLSDLIDGAAAPIPANEVTAQNYLRSTPTSPRLLLVFAAGALIVLATGLGVFTWAFQHRSDPHRSAAASNATNPNTPSTLDVTRCVHTPESQGCAVEPATAARALGISLPEPGAIPDGWQKISGHLRYWPKGPVAPDIPAIADYNEVWAPPGTDLGATGVVPDYLQLRRHLLTPGDSTQIEEADSRSRVALADGTTAINIGGSLIWARAGVWYSIYAPRLSLDQLLAIANDLP